MLAVGVVGLVLAVLLKVALTVVRRRVEAGRQALEGLREQARSAELSMQPDDRNL